MEPTRLVVGRVAKAHGIRGEVSVEVYSDAPERFTPGSCMRAGEREVIVQSARSHQGRLLVRFEGVLDRSGAEALRGVVLSIDAAEARQLDEWSFYPHEIEGFTVEDVAGRPLGTLTGIRENPANDLWIVSEGAREVLVPAVRDIVRAVDTQARRIVLDPPEGLFR